MPYRNDSQAFYMLELNWDSIFIGLEPGSQKKLPKMFYWASGDTATRLQYLRELPKL